MLIKNSKNALDELTDFAYSNALQTLNNPKYFMERSTLCPTLDVVSCNTSKLTTT